MKLKKILILIIVLLVSTGCSTSEKEISDNVENNNISEEDDTLTLDYVCEKYGMNKSEFDGVDFDAFVDYYGLTKDNIGAGGPGFLLDEYKKLEYKIKIPNYNEINPTTNEYLKEYNEKISTIIIENIKPSGSEQTCDSTVIDFEIGLIFVVNRPLSNYTLSENDIKKETSDELKEKLANYFDEYDIYSWTQPEDNTNDSKTSDMLDYSEGNCSLRIKLENGTVYGISFNKDSKESDSKEKFYDFIESVEKLARE